jgi:uncharacterized membrane protein HdeD (DUF308 family)
MTPHWDHSLARADVPDDRRFAAWIIGGPLTHDDFRRARRWLTVAGVIALIAGLAAIAVPIVASVAIAVFVGWMLLLAGIPMAAHAIARREVIRGLEAFVTLIAALYLLLFPLSGTVTLTFVLSVWLFASGFLSLSAAAQLRGDPEAWMIAAAGVLSLILGFLIAASLPSSAAWAIGLPVGIDLIFWGVRALIGAQLLRRLLEN